MRKVKKKFKYKVREYTYCLECGRVRRVFREFLLCGIHLRQYIYQGRLPGFKKASW